MKKVTMMTGFLMVTILSGLVPQALGVTITAQEILKKVDQVGYTKSSRMLMKQTIETTSGDKRSFKIDSWSQNGNEKSFMRYLAPAPSKGIGMLALENGDNIWAYFPDSDDLRKIASSAKNQSMQGSDFSYEDMASGEFGENYQATKYESISCGEKSCYQLELKPKKSSSYLRAEALIDRERFIIFKIEFYDKENNHIKTLTMSNYEKINDVWVPKRMVMKNHKRGSQTSIEVKKVKINPQVPANTFTTQNLTMF